MLKLKIAKKYLKKKLCLKLSKKANDLRKEKDQRKNFQSPPSYAALKYLLDL
jgi:hypothetical protein